MPVKAAITRDRRYKVVGEQKEKAVLRALNRGALLLHKDITDSLKGPRTGPTYERGVGTHTVSAPGEAPANDLGGLSAMTLPFMAKNANDSAGVISSAEYAADLEFGTKNMEARPFMRPAFARNVDQIKLSIQKALGETE